MTESEAEYEDDYQACQPDEKDEEILPENIEKMKQQALALNRENEQLKDWILKSKVVNEINGVGESRHELFFDLLTEIGMIPLEVRTMFELRWAKHFNDSLRSMQKQVIDARKQAESERIRQTLLGGGMGNKIPPLRKIKDNPQA